MSSSSSSSNAKLANAMRLALSNARFCVAPWPDFRLPTGDSKVAFDSIVRVMRLIKEYRLPRIHWLVFFMKLTRQLVKCLCTTSIKQYIKINEAMGIEFAMGRILQYMCDYIEDQADLVVLAKTIHMEIEDQSDLNPHRHETILAAVTQSLTPTLFSRYMVLSEGHVADMRHKMSYAKLFMHRDDSMVFEFAYAFENWYRQEEDETESSLENKEFELFHGKSEKEESRESKLRQRLDKGYDKIWDGYMLRKLIPAANDMHQRVLSSRVGADMAGYIVDMNRTEEMRAVRIEAMRAKQREAKRLREIEAKRAAERTGIDEITEDMSRATVRTRRPPPPFETDEPVKRTRMQ